MSQQHIGFVHPGLMGESLAATTQNSGNKAYWVSEGRSNATRERAERNGLIEVKTLFELCNTCSIIISVCPPHAATQMAKDVLACNFKGFYADVNAISPQRSHEICELFVKDEINYVDGGIIGLPAWKPGTTVLYLSGQNAEFVSDCFAEGPLETKVIGDEIGKASALKMCFAANSKGTAALLCAIVGAAEQLGVRSELENHWGRKGSNFTNETLEMITRVTKKAWRFSGEMEEIASTFESAGLPEGFHLAASDIYKRISKFKGADPMPTAEQVIEALLNQSNE